MTNSDITAHVLLKNEDRFVYFSLHSILPYVEKAVIFDTGSCDKTIEIVRSIKNPKIVFKQYNIKNIRQISNLRQVQLDQTKTNWIWIVDGDEIYPDSLCREIVQKIKISGNLLEGIVVGRYDLLGDVYHYQSESVGVYDLFGRKGHFALRLLNKKNIPGLHLEGIYPYEGYFDSQGRQIINRAKEKYCFTKGKLYHAMYLGRSSMGNNLEDTFHRRKYKIEWGNKFGRGHKLPEVFGKEASFVNKDAIKRRSITYEIIATMLTPIKMLKRLFLN